jgi:hypothetical protein
VIPSIDLALLIQAFISASSLSSVIMMDPRYLKLWVNWTCWLFGNFMFGGRILPVVSSFQGAREEHGFSI